jgi:hypothetical protein
MQSLSLAGLARSRPFSVTKSVREALKPSDKTTQHNAGYVEHSRVSVTAAIEYAS